MNPASLLSYGSITWKLSERAYLEVYDFIKTVLVLQQTLKVNRKLTKNNLTYPNENARVGFCIFTQELTRQVAKLKIILHDIIELFIHCIHILLQLLHLHLHYIYSKIQSGYSLSCMLTEILVRMIQ